MDLRLDQHCWLLMKVVVCPERLIHVAGEPLSSCRRARGIHPYRDTVVYREVLALVLVLVLQYVSLKSVYSETTAGVE